jgi:hypothetical protein
MKRKRVAACTILGKDYWRNFHRKIRLFGHVLMKSAMDG